MVTVFYLELRPPEVAVEACPEAETVAAVAVVADSAVAGEGTGAKAPSMVSQFLYKNCNSPQTASPYRKSPSSGKTQLNVEMSLLVVKISQNKKRVRWGADPRSSLLKKTACVDKRI